MLALSGHRRHTRSVESGLRGALASVGASFEQVVKLNNYVVDIGTNLAHYRDVRDAAGEHHDRRTTTSAPRRVVRG